MRAGAQCVGGLRSKQLRRAPTLRRKRGEEERRRGGGDEKRRERERERRGEGEEERRLSPFTEPSSNSLNEGSPRTVPFTKGPKTKEPLRNTPKGYP